MVEAIVGADSVGTVEGEAVIEAAVALGASAASASSAIFKFKNAHYSSDAERKNSQGKSGRVKEKAQLFMAGLDRI